MKRLGKGNNNIMHLIDVTVTPGYKAVNKPSTVPLPASTTQLIHRTPNPGAELDVNLVVPNEVIVLELVRKQGVSVADVYDWSVEDGGYTLLSVLKGENLDEYLDTLNPSINSEDAKLQDHIFDEIANVLKAIKAIELPSQVRYGGLRFNSSGEIESGEMPLPYGGPYDSLSDMYKGMMRRQLENSEKSSVLAGWEGSDMRERLEKFLEEGVDEALKNVKSDRPILIHGDLSELDFQTRAMTSATKAKTPPPPLQTPRICSGIEKRRRLRVW